MQRHIMIDIETLGRGPTAAIVAIGAVAWDQDIGQRWHAPRCGKLDTLHIPVDACDSQRQGGSLDASTVAWWLSKSQAARGALLKQPRLLLADALDDLSRFFSPSEDEWVWANSPAFDLTILRSAYECMGLNTPWCYWQERDYRTLAELLPHVEAPQREGIHHTALDDARHQALHLSSLIGALS